MTDNQPSVMSVALKYGFITALVAIVYSLILLISDLNDNGWLAAVSYMILIAGILLAMKQYKAINYGYMSYGQGLGIGTIVSAIYGVLSAIFMWIYTSFVDPEYMERQLLKSEAEMLERGMSQEQIDAAMEMTQSFQGPVMLIVIGTLSAIIMGFIFSLILAAIMKNNRPEFE
jgi:hypothetical protein